MAMADKYYLCETGLVRKRPYWRTMPYHFGVIPPSPFPHEVPIPTRLLPGHLLFPYGAIPPRSPHPGHLPFPGFDQGPPVRHVPRPALSLPLPLPLRICRRILEFTAAPELHCWLHHGALVYRISV